MTTAGRRPSASDIQEQNNRPKIEIAPTQMIRIRRVVRIDLQHQHEQRRHPQAQPDGAGLADAGQAGYRQAARIIEQLAPHGLLDFPDRRGQLDRSRIDLQRPGKRLARLVHPPFADQPMRRLRHPGADQQRQQCRDQAHHEQAAPADGWFQIRAGQRAQQRARRQQAGGQSGDPAALIGRHEFLHDRDIDGVEAGHAHADKEPADRQEQPAVIRGQRHRAGGDREVQHRKDHHLAPADLVGHPAPEQRADAARRCRKTAESRPTGRRSDASRRR